MLSYVNKCAENGYTISFEPNLPKWHVVGQIYVSYFCPVSNNASFESIYVIFVLNFYYGPYKASLIWCFGMTRRSFGHSGHLVMALRRVAALWRVVALWCCGVARTLVVAIAALVARMLSEIPLRRRAWWHRLAGRFATMFVLQLRGTKIVAQGEDCNSVNLIKYKEIWKV